MKLRRLGFKPFRLSDLVLPQSEILQTRGFLGSFPRPRTNTICRGNIPGKFDTSKPTFFRLQKRPIRAACPSFQRLALVSLDLCKFVANRGGLTRIYGKKRWDYDAHHSPNKAFLTALFPSISWRGVALEGWAGPLDSHDQWMITFFWNTGGCRECSNRLPFITMNRLWLYLPTVNQGIGNRQYIPLRMWASCPWWWKMKSYSIYSD